MIKESRLYYIYRHTTKDSNIVFYIGRGTKTKKDLKYNHYGRAFSKNRNIFWKHLVNKHDYVVDILIESTSFSFICQKEIELIALYGRRDLNKGTLVNLTNGGESGALGRIYKPTPESIEKMRQKLIGRKMPDWFAATVSKRMKGNKYRVGHPNSPETIRANAILHFIPIYMYDLEGKFVREFDSVKSSAKFFNVHEATIIQCTKGKQQQSHGYQFKYTLSENCGEINYKIKKNGCIKIEHINLLTNKSTIYDTIKKASQSLTINESKIRHNLYGESKIVENNHKFNYYQIKKDMSVILKAKGVRQVSRSEMMSFSVPAKTESYSPVSNQEIIETTLEELDKNGFQVKSEFHKRDGSMQKFVGGFIISGGSSEANLMFGYKNSYDRSMTAAYALGAQIIVCSNSVVRGEQSLIRKHTGDALSIIKNGISEGIKRLGDNFLSFQNEMKKMKEIEISKSVYAGLVGRLYIEDEIITSHQLSIIKKEFDKESYDYGVKDSLYNLYQAVTLSLKTAHPVRFLNDHLAANEFFTTEAGIIVPTSVPVFADTQPANQMNIYDIPGVTAEAAPTDVMVETAPKDIEALPMASKDCFKPTTSETTTEYQDLM